MYLLYTDESGDLNDPASSVFVIGGVAVHEDAIRPFAGEINATMNRYVGQKLAMQLELHGAPMRTGRGEWKQLGGRKRHGLAHAVLRLVCEWEHADTGSEVQVFAVAIDRNHSLSPTETSYGELLFTFDEFLREGRRGGDPHNGVLVADRSRYQRTLEAWVEVARARRSRPKGDPRRLYALAETPFFVDSKSTRLMQAADLVAYALYRGYNAGDWDWASTVIPALALPRLIHFTSDPNCSCPACQPEQPSTPSAATAAPTAPGPGSPPPPRGGGRGGRAR